MPGQPDVMIEKTCDVYGENGVGQPIEVDFKEINIKDFDSDRYKRQIIYNIDCGEKSSSNPQLKMIFKSDVSSFNNQLIATNKQDSLGLQLFSNGITLAPYQEYSFYYNNKPSLVVKPIIHEPNENTFGTFFASGTLSIEYE